MSPREVEFDDTHTAASQGLREISMYSLACAIFTQPGCLQFLADSRDNTQTPQRDVSGDLVNVQPPMTNQYQRSVPPRALAPFESHNR
eukprot:191729-Prymnesium_polylepis.1